MMKIGLSERTFMRRIKKGVSSMTNSAVQTKEEAGVEEAQARKHTAKWNTPWKNSEKMFDRSKRCRGPGPKSERNKR